MMTRALGRYGFQLSVAGLLAAILVVAAFFAIVALPDIARIAGISGLPGIGGGPSPSPTAGQPTPQPTSPMAGPIGIAIPPETDCGACHVGSTGTVVTKDIPILAHPLEGWRDCTACHAPEGLVETAPGHSSLHKADCLVCHQQRTAESSAPPRPHHIETGKACVTCHGPTVASPAPLPTDMSGRTNCWVCHSGDEYDELFLEDAVP